MTSVNDVVGPVGSPKALTPLVSVEGKDQPQLLEELTQKVNELVSMVNGLRGRGQMRVARNPGKVELTSLIESMLQRIQAGPHAMLVKQAVGDTLEPVTQALAAFRDTLTTYKASITE